MSATIVGPVDIGLGGGKKHIWIKLIGKFDSRKVASLRLDVKALADKHGLKFRQYEVKSKR
jgi:hypothetical protein